MADLLKDDIRIFPDSETLAVAAARIFEDAAKRAISGPGGFSVALSGGSTPRPLFRILGSDCRNSIDWDKVHMFWSDERSVQLDDAQSNYRLAYDEMLSKVAIPAGNIHRIKGELAPDEAAKEYEEDLRRYFSGRRTPKFDLVLLGVGQDGHTASLFPGSETLFEKTRYAVPSFSESAGNWRVTLTLSVLNNASEILFLVSGRAKAGILRDIFKQGRREHYPAGLVRPSSGELIWLLDKEAASGLQEG